MALNKTLALLAISLSAPLLLAGTCSAATPDMQLGVLEEAVVPNSADGTLRSAVRLLFVKSGTGWKALCEPGAAQNSQGCTFPSANVPIDWTVQSNGKPLTTIQTQGWIDTSYLSDIGLLTISSTLLPIVGEKNLRYAGWMNVPVHKPLLVSTNSLPAATQTWKEITSDAGALKKAWPLFRQTTSHVETCATDKQGNSANRKFGAEKIRSSKIKDIEIDESWQSSQGQRLIHVQIKPQTFKQCDGPVRGATQLWLYQSPKGRLTKLPAQSEDVMRPIEFADFGADQQDAALFQVNGYNLAGYVLYFNHFQDQVRVTWTYH